MMSTALKNTFVGGGASPAIHILRKNQRDGKTRLKRVFSAHDFSCTPQREHIEIGQGHLAYDLCGVAGNIPGYAAPRAISS